MMALWKFPGVKALDQVKFYTNAWGVSCFGRGKWSGQIHIVKVYYRRKPNDQR